MQRSAIPYWDGDCPTVTELLQRPAQCAMVGALLCRATNPLENTLRAIAAWSQRHRDRERAKKKVTLRTKISANIFTLEIQAMTSGNTNTRLWEQRVCDGGKNEKVFFFLFPFFPFKKLLSCIHCSTEYAHSISLMSYSYANVRHKLGSTSPCSTHRGMSYGTSSFMLLGKITNKKKKTQRTKDWKAKSITRMQN